MCITCILNVLMPLYMFIQALCKSLPSLYGRIYALSNMINANDIKLTLLPHAMRNLQVGSVTHCTHLTHARIVVLLVTPKTANSISLLFAKDLIARDNP